MTTEVRPEPAQDDDADASSPLLAAMQRLEKERRLDGAVAALARVAAPLARSSRLRRALSGGWFGHALHPVLTDFPLGMWMSTTVLDLIGGEQSVSAAQRLAALGAAAALPTMLTGVNDWLSADTTERRVGTVHAAINTTAFAVYGMSLVVRRRSRPITCGLSVLGGVVATCGGYVGGHLSTARDTALRASGAGQALQRCRPPIRDDRPNRFG